MTQPVDMLLKMIKKKWITLLLIIVWYCDAKVLPSYWIPTTLKRGGNVAQEAVPLVTSSVEKKGVNKRVDVAGNDQEQLYEAYNMLHSLAQVCN